MIETSIGTLVARHHDDGIIVEIVPAQFLHTYWLRRTPNGEVTGWNTIWREVNTALKEACPSFHFTPEGCSISEADYIRLVLMAE